MVLWRLFTVTHYYQCHQYKTTLVSEPYSQEQFQLAFSLYLVSVERSCIRHIRTVQIRNLFVRSLDCKFIGDSSKYTRYSKRNYRNNFGFPCFSLVDSKQSKTLSGSGPQYEGNIQIFSTNMALICILGWGLEFKN